MDAGKPPPTDQSRAPAPAPAEARPTPLASFMQNLQASVPQAPSSAETTQAQGQVFAEALSITTDNARGLADADSATVRARSAPTAQPAAQQPPASRWDATSTEQSIARPDRREGDAPPGGAPQFPRRTTD